MEQNKSDQTPHKEISPEQRQKQKTFIAYTIMVVVGAIIMWLIFSPSDTEHTLQQSGFNTDVPAPTDKQLTGDKQTAYEEERYAKKQEERTKQLQDLASMFGPTQDEPADEQAMTQEPSQPRDRINASAAAYRDINRTLGRFYEQPKEDPQKEQMQKKIDDLNALLAGSENHKPNNTMEDQVTLMEKSYQLAAKYMPQGQGFGQAPPTSQTQQVPVTTKNGKVPMISVGQITASEVSTLGQSISDSACLTDLSQPRNRSFHTAVGTAQATNTNTIRACVHDNQTITDGQAVRMRLLEPIRAGETVIPRNTLVTGIGKIAGERLGISITSLEYEGLLIPIELTVLDTDGQEGIFVPGSMEVNALKEVAANMGSSLGTSVSITNQGAGDQLLSELGKGVIQGASQYVSKKIRVVNVHLKAGYQVLLFQPKN